MRRKKVPQGNRSGGAVVRFPSTATTRNFPQPQTATNTYDKLPHLPSKPKTKKDLAQESRPKMAPPIPLEGHSNPFYEFVTNEAHEETDLAVEGDEEHAGE